MDGGPLGVADAATVGIAPTPDGKGYWVATSNGGVFTFGDAQFYGSAGNLKLTAPIVGIVATADGKGYYLVSSNGGVFTFGDALFYGSAGSLTLAAPIVGMSVTSDGKGYYLVGSDGGVFTYGDAAFAGTLSSTFGGPSPDGAAIGIAANPVGPGYLIATAEGAVIAYGGAPFFGSPTLSGVTPVEPIVGISYTPDGTGYWLAAADGGVFTFNASETVGSGTSATSVTTGHAGFFGSVPSVIGTSGIAASHHGRRHRADPLSGRHCPSGQHRAVTMTKAPLPGGLRPFGPFKSRHRAVLCGGVGRGPMGSVGSHDRRGQGPGLVGLPRRARPGRVAGQLHQRGQVGHGVGLHRLGRRALDGADPGGVLARRLPIVTGETLAPQRP